MENNLNLHPNKKPAMTVEPGAIPAARDVGIVIERTAGDYA